MAQLDTHQKIAVMQAFADGKRVEYRKRYGGAWTHMPAHTLPVWNWFDLDYRIAPDHVTAADIPWHLAPTDAQYAKVRTDGVVEFWGIVHACSIIAKQGDGVTAFSRCR